MRNYPFFLLIVFMLSSWDISGMYNSHSIPQDKKEYVCPPCGCNFDDQIYPSPGVCDYCKMPLIEKPTKFKAALSYKVHSYFSDDNVMVIYPKFLYPAFIIGFLVGLLMLIQYIRKKNVNIFLAMILIVLSLYGFRNQLYGVNHGLTSNFATLFIPISWIIILGPLFYFYVRSLFSSKFIFKNKSFLHFSFIVPIFLWYLFHLLQNDEKRQSAMISPFEPAIGHWEQMFTVLIGFAYIFLAYKFYRRWKKKHQLVERSKIFWLSRFLLVSFFLLVIWFSLIFLNFWLYDFGVTTLTYNPLWTAIALYIYWICVEILLSPKFFFINQHRNLTAGRIKISQIELSQYVDRINKIMNEKKPYLDHNLRLNQLADSLSIHPKILSMVLNIAMNTKFYDYVNMFRAEEAKLLLIEPENRRLTIEAIANKAGFKSRSSFYVAFRKSTGQTPYEFTKNQELKI